MSTLKFWNAEAEQWESISCITGPQGEPGPQGPAGADGKDADALIPDYVLREAERLAAVVQGRQNENTVSFIACADLHYALNHDYAAYQKAAMTHMGQAMKCIRQAVRIDFAAMLGDMIWDNGETSTEALQEIRFVNSCLHEGFGELPVFRSRGNHDNGDNCGADFTDSQVFSHIGSYNAGAVYDSANRVSGCCYRDFEDVKLRVICLNSSEGGGCLFTQAQMDWLATVLDLSEKGSDWRTILLSHHPLDWGRSGGANPIPVVNTASGILAAFHGHIHNFKVDTMANTGITRISIPNACYSRENQYGTAYDVDWKEDVTYAKVPDTAQDTAFCVVTVDMSTKKIYADHYGAGYSRVVACDGAALGTFSVINTLTNVQSSNTVTEISEGAAYTGILTAEDGYAISSVTVTMGGVDVTDSAYSGGIVSIASVTGDIVITAEAEKVVVNENNLLLQAQAHDSTDVYNGGLGYKDGYRISTSNQPSYESAADGFTITGYIPYTVPASGVPGTIYVKGLDWTEDTNCRLYFFGEDKLHIATPQITGNAQSGSMNSIGDYFTLEELGDSYWKLTPLADGNSSVMVKTFAGVADTKFIRFSLKGSGANLTVTVDEPIE